MWNSLSNTSTIKMPREALMNGWTFSQCFLLDKIVWFVYPQIRRLFPWFQNSVHSILLILWQWWLTSLLIKNVWKVWKWMVVKIYTNRCGFELCVILCTDGDCVDNQHNKYEHIKDCTLYVENSKIWIFNAEVKLFSTNTSCSYNCPYAQLESHTRIWCFKD